MKYPEITNTDKEYCQQVTSKWKEKINNEWKQSEKKFSIVKKINGIDSSSSKKENTQREKNLLDMENYLKGIKSQITFVTNNQCTNRLKDLGDQVRERMLNFQIMKTDFLRQDFLRIKKIDETFTSLLKQINEILNENETLRNSRVNQKLGKFREQKTKNMEQIHYSIDKYEQNEDNYQDGATSKIIWNNLETDRELNSVVVQHTPLKRTFENSYLRERKMRKEQQIEQTKWRTLKNNVKNSTFKNTLRDLASIKEDVLRLSSKLTQTNCHKTANKVICLKRELHLIEEVNQEIIEKKFEISSLITDLEMICDDYKTWRILDSIERRLEELKITYQNMTSPEKYKEELLKLRNFAVSIATDDQSIIQKIDKYLEVLNQKNRNNFKNSSQRNLDSKIQYAQQNRIPEDQTIQISSNNQQVVIEMYNDNLNHKSNETVIRQHEIKKVENIGKFDDLEVLVQKIKNESKSFSEETRVSVPDVSENKSKQRLFILPPKIRYDKPNVIPEDEMTQNSEDIQQVQTEIGKPEDTKEKSYEISRNQGIEKLENTKKSICTTKWENRHFSDEYSRQDEDDKFIEARDNQDMNFSEDYRKSEKTEWDVKKAENEEKISPKQKEKSKDQEIIEKVEMNFEKIKPEIMGFTGSKLSKKYFELDETLMQNILKLDENRDEVPSSSINPNQKCDNNEEDKDQFKETPESENNIQKGLCKSCVLQKFELMEARITKNVKLILKLMKEKTPPLLHQRLHNILMCYQQILSECPRELENHEIYKIQQIISFALAKLNKFQCRSENSESEDRSTEPVKTVSEILHEAERFHLKLSKLLQSPETYEIHKNKLKKLKKIVDEMKITDEDLSERRNYLSFNISNSLKILDKKINRSKDARTNYELNTNILIIEKILEDLKRNNPGLEEEIITESEEKPGDPKNNHLELNEIPEQTEEAKSYSENNTDVKKKSEDSDNNSPDLEETLTEMNIKKEEIITETKETPEDTENKLDLKEKSVQEILEKVEEARSYSECKKADFEEKPTELESEEAKIIGKIKQKLEQIKPKIVEFIGLRSSGKYFELDETLMLLILNLDSIQLDKNNDLQTSKVELIKEIQSYFRVLDERMKETEDISAIENEIHQVVEEIQCYDGSYRSYFVLGKWMCRLRSKLDQMGSNEELAKKKNSCINKINYLSQKLKNKVRNNVQI